jgi:ankyrin repeat protein
MATMKSDYQTMLHLLQNGADPNYHFDSAGQSSFDIAMENDDLRAVQMLLDYGAQPQSLSAQQGRKFMTEQFKRPLARFAAARNGTRQ